MAAKDKKEVHEKACLHSAQLARQAWQGRQSLRENQASIQQSTKTQQRVKRVEYIHWNDKRGGAGDKQSEQDAARGMEWTGLTMRRGDK